MSDIGTIEDVSGALPVPSSVTTDTASPLAISIAVDTSSPIFPIEVFEHIIDNCCVDEAHGWYNRFSIRDDQKTLLACALTCKAWLPRGRFQLLRRVTFSHMSHMLKFSRLLKAHPDFASAVQCLNISKEQAYLYRGKPEWHADAFLMVLARRTPMLKCLVFEGAYEGCISFDRRLDMYIPEFPAINSLSLSCVTLSSVSDLGRLILSIPALRTLSCKFVSFKKNGFDVRGLPPRVTRARLTSVTLRYCPEDIVDLLLATSTAELIEAFDVDMSIAAHEESRLVQHSCKSLRALQIADNMPQQPSCELSHNTHLEELVINVANSNYVDWIPKSLSTMTTSAMQEVTINILGASEPERVSAKCAAIDDVLSNPRFARLRKFRLMFRRDTMDGGDRELVERYMLDFPKLLRRGVLSVDCRESRKR